MLQKVKQRYGQRAKIVLTDVRKAPQVMQLITDSTLATDFLLKRKFQKEIDESELDFKSKLTIRFIDFSKVYDSESGKAYSVADLQEDATLRQKLK